MMEHLISLGVTSIGVVHLPNAFGEAGVAAAESVLAKHGRPPLNLVASLEASGENAELVARPIMSHSTLSTCPSSATVASATSERQHKGDVSLAACRT